MPHPLSRRRDARRPLLFPLPLPLPAILASLVALAALAPRAAAQTGAELLVRPFKAGDLVETRGGAMALESGHTDNADADFQLAVYETAGRVREPEGGGFVPRFGYDLVWLDLDTDDPALPKRLVDASVGAAVALPDVAGFEGGVAVGVGYAGDTPFADSDAYYALATIAYERALDEHSTLQLVLDYDGNRSVFPDVPLPGVTYVRRVDETVTFTLGVPFTRVDWRPDDRWRVQFLWTLVDTIGVRASYRVAGPWSVFGTLGRRNEAFHLEEFDAGGGSDDRLLFKQKVAEVGLRWDPRDDLSFQLAGGYAFGQEFTRGWDTRDEDLVAEPSDEPYVRAAFEARF